MCGIVGKYNYRSREPVSSELVEAMCEKIAYRGPDDSGVYSAGPIGLGHRRLSIIDLSAQGRQPMSSHDRRLWITYNGEIYNFQELRKDLLAKGYRFQSACDTEVIIYLYQEYGERCLQYLRGMFAFALWDRERSRLFLARDRIGKKPLFYYHDGKTLIFASEIKSILADPAVSREIHFPALYDYFTYLYVPDPKTIYKNIHKLEPAHYLLCSEKGISKKEYWDISFQERSRADINESAAELLKILEKSVELRMISDVPLGAFLSGGLDSSCVVALMARQQSRPVTTCSIGFDSKEYDEIEFARTVAEKFNTDHHEFTVKEKAQPILADIAYHFDEPFADSSSVPTFYVSKLARQRVTVALSGDGGDENFAGYEKYFMDDLENKFRTSIPGFIRRNLFPALSKLVQPWEHKIFQKACTLLNTLSFPADYGFYLTNSHFDAKLWAETINDDLKRQLGDYDPFSVTRHYYHRADSDNHLARILYTDLKMSLPGDMLVKVDRMSMAHSLEVRSPLLDHHLVEFVAGLPSRFKYRRGQKKYILKHALRHILPNKIMYRKKMGFSVPLAEWFRSELKEMGEHYLFAENKGLKHFFAPGPLRRIWEKHQAGQKDYATVLWSFLMFELWYRAFME